MIIDLINKENNVIALLLNELKKLNKHISTNTKMSELIKNNGIFLYGFNPASKVEPDAYKKYVSFINAITHILEEFDINKRNTGYAYIVDSVMLIIDQNRMDLSMLNDIYPYIKIKYRLNSISSVEHNIRNAINSAYNRCMNGKITSRMIDYLHKPTNKDFIFTVAHEVCTRMCADLIKS